MGLASKARRASASIVYSSVDGALFHTAMSGVCGVALTIISWIILLLTFPISMIFCLKVVKEYERAVIFRLGRLLPGGARGPGLFFVMPCIDTYRKVDLRVISFDIPPQEVLSKDSVTVSVDAVVYFRIQNPVISVTNVNDAFYSTKLLAQTTLRNVLGTKNLSEMLSEREVISHWMSTVLDEATDPWGVKVERVEVKDIRLPQQLMRAMAAEAEATREARAKVIAATGEKNASTALKEAAEVISQNPAAIQLRYLQALSSIATEHNSTIIFPLPIDLFGGFFSGSAPCPCPVHGPAAMVHQSHHRPASGSTGVQVLSDSAATVVASAAKALSKGLQSMSRSVSLPEDTAETEGQIVFTAKRGAWAEGESSSKESGIIKTWKKDRPPEGATASAPAAASQDAKSKPPRDRKTSNDGSISQAESGHHQPSVHFSKRNNQRTLQKSEGSATAGEARSSSGSYDSNQETSVAGELSDESPLLPAPPGEHQLRDVQIDVPERESRL